MRNTSYSYETPTNTHPLTVDARHLSLGTASRPQPTLRLGKLYDAHLENDIIIFDGSKGDFIVSSSMQLKDLQNKTIVGINNARVCTEFYLSPELHQLMNDKKVLEQNTSKADQVLTLSNGKRVGEPREYLVRQTLIDKMQDPEEKFRNAGLFSFSNCQNIIIRNLSLQGPGAIDVGGNDLLTLSRGSKHVWVDHVDFCDGMDGNFDINSFSDFITVSWCRFHYSGRTYIHANTNLVGSSDRAEQNGEDNLNVTYAFCEWGEGCDQFRIEGCYFAEGVKKIFSQKDAKAFVFVDNHYTEKFKQPDNLGNVTLPYRYEVIPVEDVPKVVSEHVGATLSDPLNIAEESK